MRLTPSLVFCLGTLFVLGLGPSLRADVVRYHYCPKDLCGNTSLKVNPEGGVGEWRSWALGVRKQNYYCPPKANQMVTYIHPATARPVNVPIAFPEGTPRITTETNAYMYSYTAYTIRVDFLPDGSVDVTYNSGLFRPIQ